MIDDSIKQNTIPYKDLFNIMDSTPPVHGITITKRTITIHHDNVAYEFTHSEIALLLRFLRYNVNYDWLHQHTNYEAE